jgi:hypothetical protein
MSETKAPRGRHADVVALAAEGVPPREIVKRLGIPSGTVHGHLWRARRDGTLKITFPRGGFRGREPGSTIVVMPRAVADLIRPAAEARGLTVCALATAVLARVAVDRLVDAVLDDGGEQTEAGDDCAA